MSLESSILPTQNTTYVEHTLYDTMNYFLLVFLQNLEHLFLSSGNESFKSHQHVLLSYRGKLFHIGISFMYQKRLEHQCVMDLRGHNPMGLAWWSRLGT